MNHETETAEAKAERQENGQLDALEVCARLPLVAVPFAKIVGRWVWITFDAKPDAGIRGKLVHLGFRWNPKRNAWQHSGGVPCRRNPKIDPRFVYGELSVADVIA